MTIGLCDKEGKGGDLRMDQKQMLSPAVTQRGNNAPCWLSTSSSASSTSTLSSRSSTPIKDLSAWVSNTFWVRYLEAKIRGTSRGTLDQDQGTLRGGARGRWPYSGNLHFGPAAEGHVDPGIVKIFDHLNHPSHPAHHCHCNFSKFCTFHSGIAYLSDCTVKLRLFRICLNAAPLKLSSTVGPH